MPYVDTPALRIHYEEAGSGPAVFVLVHGNFASWRWWKPVLKRFPPGLRAYAMDLRGCGATLAPSGDTASLFAIPQLASDLHDFQEGLGLPPFHLVGHSLGGAVALEFALRHQVRVRSLTLVAPPPPAGLAAMRQGNSRSARLLRRIDPDHDPSMRALRQGYRVQQALGTNRVMLRRALVEMMPTASPEGKQFESLLDDAARMSPEAMVSFLQALQRWNVEDELRNLRVRTLILSGGKDVLVPTAALAPMARMLPRGELLVWPDVGHSPQLEKPDAFVHLLSAAAKRSPVMRLRTWLWGVGQRLNGAPDLLAGFDEAMGAD